MSTPERIASLKSKHAQLDVKLSDETARPQPDESILHNLKREKLQIKDQLRTMGAT